MGQKIKHIIIIVKENHSFDNLFGRLHGVNGATTAMVGQKKVKLSVTPDRLTRDIYHSGNNGMKAVDGGKMNGFATQRDAIQKGKDVADSQYTQRQIPDYFRYASTYAIADRFFSTILGPSFPNHLVLVAGQSAKRSTIPIARARDRTRGAVIQTRQLGSPRTPTGSSAACTHASALARLPQKQTRDTGGGSTMTLRSTSLPSSGHLSTR